MFQRNVTERKGIPMENRWSDQVAAVLDGLDLLVYATRLIGQEAGLVLWGGGNSSIKLSTSDHVGRQIQVLWIKGSGSDMRTMSAKQFTPLRLNDLLALWDHTSMSDEEMVAYQAKCILDLVAPKPSIETLLHAFISARHVYHTHADAICTLTDVPNSKAMISRVYGDQVALIPYVRPGFSLAKLVGEAYRRRPDLRAVILDKHGLVTWGDTAKEAYSKTIQMVQDAARFIKAKKTTNTIYVNGSFSSSSDARRCRAAEVASLLRAAISRDQRSLLTYNDSEEVLNFVNNPCLQELSQAGPFTPDHILHTKATPLVLEIPIQGTTDTLVREVEKGVAQYREAYTRYFEHFTRKGAVMRDPYPRVILIPGLGMFTCGKNRRACRIVHDIYLHTIEVILAASSLEQYSVLSPEDLCDFEYWPLETYKLTLQPPEKELSRRIALVTGAAGAIGREIATRLVAAGASVVLTDINEQEVCALAEELNDQSGETNTLAIPMDVTNEASVEQAFRKAILAYGGLDILVSNAGIACSAPVDCLSVADWNNSFAVNSTGHFLVCRMAMQWFKRQRLGGNVVVVSTKNVLAPGKDFGAYSASKAAQAQLSRVLAIEGAEFGIRVNMVNPDAVFDGSGIWSTQLRNARAQAYGIQVENLESFCVARNLLKVKITAQDIAEAVLFLSCDRSSKTTAAMIPVDGGAKEAFLR